MAAPARRGVGAFKAVVGHEALVLRIAELPAGERRIAVPLCAAAGGEGCRCDLDVAAAQPFLIVGSYEVVAAGEVPRLVVVSKGVPAQRCLGEVQFAVFIQPLVRNVQSLLHDVGFAGTQRGECPAKPCRALILRPCDVARPVHIPQVIAGRQIRCTPQPLGTGYGCFGKRLLRAVRRCHMRCKPCAVLRQAGADDVQRFRRFLYSCRRDSRKRKTCARQQRSHCAYHSIFLHKDLLNRICMPEFPVQIFSDASDDCIYYTIICCTSQQLHLLFHK